MIQVWEKNPKHAQAFSHLGKVPLFPFARFSIAPRTSSLPCYHCRLHPVPLVKPQATARGCGQVIAVSSLLLLPSRSFPVLCCDCSTLTSALGMYLLCHGLIHRLRSLWGCVCSHVGPPLAVVQVRGACSTMKHHFI